MTMPRPQAETRPKQVEISIWLWIAYLVLELVGTGLLLLLAQVRADIIGVALGAVVAALAALIFVVLMNKGRNWARIVLAVFGGLRLLFLPIVLIGLTGASLVIGALQLPLLIGAIVTMFLPAANAWFRARQPGF